VIARNSAFTYKGKAVDVKQVARELGVRLARQTFEYSGAAQPTRGGDRGLRSGAALKSVGPVGLPRRCKHRACSSWRETLRLFILARDASRRRSKGPIALEGVPDDEQAKIAAGNTARVYNFDVPRLSVPA
jgi:hypothetical protein